MFRSHSAVFLSHCNLKSAFRKSPLHNLTQLHLLSDSKTALHRQETISKVDEIVKELKNTDSQEIPNRTLARIIVVSSSCMLSFVEIQDNGFVFDRLLCRRFESEACWISLECGELWERLTCGLLPEKLYNNHFNSFTSKKLVDYLEDR